MFKRYMHKRERYFAFLDDNREVRPFEWGMEFIGGNPNEDDPMKFFREHSEYVLNNSDEYFSLPAIKDFRFESRLQAESSLKSQLKTESSEDSRLKAGLKTESSEDSRLKAGLKTESSEDSRLKAGLKTESSEDSRLKAGLKTESSEDSRLKAGLKTESSEDSRLKAGLKTPNLSWTSSIETPSLENNTAYARLFPHEKDKKAAVVVLPHWNAKAGSYFDLCKFFNKVGLTSLRLTLPYHEERMPPDLERADFVVSPNVGRTIQSIRQAALDTKAAVKWLYEEGYEKVGVVGTSIGSCVAFLAFVHDPTIKSVVFNHVSGYVADVAWRGLSTYHVREGLENDITLDELRECWMPVSPMRYIEKMATLPARPQRYIYTLYDLSFPIDLSLDTMDALKNNEIKHSKVSIPCGHYTLGEKPWVYLDGYKIISFLRKNLR